LKKLIKNTHSFSILEVNWKDLRERDVSGFIEKTSDFDCDRIILTKEKSDLESDEIKIMEENDIMDFLK
jgi:hypothetical protein